MASSLLLSPLAAQALPLEEGSITVAVPGPSVPTTETATDDGAATGANVGGAQDSGQVPAAPLVAEFGVSDTDTGSTEAGQEPAEVQPAPANSEAIDSPATDTLLPDPVDEVGMNLSPLEESNDPAVNGDSVAAEVPGLVDTAPIDADALVDAGSQVADQGTVAAVVPIAESAEASTESTESTEPTIEETEEPTSFWEIVEGIEAPEGSESWSEEEWVDFLETPEGIDFTDQVLDGMVGTEEFDTIVDILVDFMESGDETYLDELMDYFLYLFDGNEEWAMEAYNGVIQALINEGFLDEEEVLPADGGTGTESPEAAPPVEKPVIKPAGNITKPVVDKKVVAQAIAKPVAAAAGPQLAETGSDGGLILGGSGLLLVLIGALTLRLRRKPRAH
jgi:hypothetical protein